MIGSQGEWAGKVQQCVLGLGCSREIVTTSRLHPTPIRIDLPFQPIVTRVVFRLRLELIRLHGFVDEFGRGRNQSGSVALKSIDYLCILDTCYNTG